MRSRRRRVAWPRWLTACFSAGDISAVVLPLCSWKNSGSYPKPFAAARRLEQPALDAALAREQNPPRRVGKGQHADEPRGAAVVRHAAHEAEQVGVVVGVARLLDLAARAVHLGEPGRVNARPPAERVDRQAAVVGEGEARVALRVRRRLQAGVVAEGAARLLRLKAVVGDRVEVARLHAVAERFGEHLGELGGLALVPRGDEQLHEKIEMGSGVAPAGGCSQGRACLGGATPDPVCARRFAHDGSRTTTPPSTDPRAGRASRASRGPGSRDRSPARRSSGRPGP